MPRTSVGPLYQTQVASLEIIIHTEILQLSRILKAIQVKVVNRLSSKLVGLDQSEGWAFHRPGMTHTPNDPPGQRGLARTQLACQVDNTFASQQSTQLSAQGLGRLIIFQYLDITLHG